MKPLTPEYLEELSKTKNGFYSWDYVAGLATRVIELEGLLRWIPVTERLPEVMKKVEVVCLSEYNKHFTGLAQYIPAHTVLEEEFINEDYWGDEYQLSEYDEEEDKYYVKEGWFEYTLEGEMMYKLSIPVICWREIPKFVPTANGVK